MGYKNLRECLKNLAEKGWVLEIKEELDPVLEIPFIQRQAFKKNGPVLFFSNPKRCNFPLVSNIFGTRERIHYIFKDGVKILKKLFRGKIPLKEIPRNLGLLARTFLFLKPKIVKDGPILKKSTTINSIPHLKFWPNDGGCFITLPQVYSEDPEKPGIFNSNMGMYRIQISGNNYTEDVVGLHYQIHRGIGRHHLKAILKKQNLKVNIFVGGPPPMILAAIMPLPDGFPEILFANFLAGFRIPLIKKSSQDLPIPAEADFCIVGEVPPLTTLPEGPFGDHLGYYSLKHEFPVILVKKVLHRKDAIWPFTSVGRPPQEDSIIGEFIHELFEPLVSRTFSGVKEIHAVDACGVHPLLLAIGSEGYVPFETKKIPQQILTQALHLLGDTQTSLTKYLFIVAGEDDPTLTTKDIPRFFHHLLTRVNLERDLHFITRTTMDTLDYSGISLNQGSKLIMAGAGTPIRKLKTDLPLIPWPGRFKNPKVVDRGIIVIEGPKHDVSKDSHDPELEKFARSLIPFKEALEGFPMIVVVDDSEFASRSWDNFLWVTFTRSDPATDIYGVDSYYRCKHWGCKGSLIIDARSKSHHAPELEEDQKVVSRVKELAKKGGPLAGVIEV